MKIRIIASPADLNSVTASLQELSVEKETLCFSEKKDHSEIYGCDRVRFIETGSEIEQPAILAMAIQEVIDPDEEVLYVFPCSDDGDEAASLFACRMGWDCLLSIESICIQDKILVTKNVYSSNLKAQFRVKKLPFVISLKTLPSKKIDETKKADLIYETLNLRFGREAFYTLLNEEEKEESDTLLNADFVITAGRGVGNKENVKLIETLCEKADACFAATRPLIYDSYARKETLVGASGKTIAPKTCLVLGASGSAAFMAGIEKSKTIIAINSDPDAAIFRYADIGIIDDCVECTKHLIELYGKEDE